MRKTFCSQTIGVALGAMLLTYGGPSARADTQTVAAQQTPQTPQTAQAAPAEQRVVVVNPPPAADSPSRTNRTLTGGLATFALSYGAALVVASSSSHAGDGRLFVPLLGPWLDLGARGGCPVANMSCDRETTYKVLLVVDGVFQVAGVLGIVSGILSSGERERTVATTAQVHVVPVSVAHGSPGLAAFGTF